MPTVFFSSPHPIPWYRQFPDGQPVWGDWRFLFDERSGDYDYLVAFDDLHAPLAPRCPPENTVHIATEPMSVRRYDRRFTDQFGLCLTIDPDLVHPHRVFTQPGLNWAIGWDPLTGSAPGAMSFRALETLFDEPRTRLVSVIASNKAFTAGHRRRLDFALRLKARLGDRIDLFGRGVVTVADKLAALRGYRFHVALENTRIEHYFTEKLSDGLIAGCYPVYFGCPNLGDYVPVEAFRPIDIEDFAAAVATLEQAIEERLDETRREALREARRRIMYDHNLFAMLSRVLGAHAAGSYGHTAPVARRGAKLLPLSHRSFRAGGVLA